MPLPNLALEDARSVSGGNQEHAPAVSLPKSRADLLSLAIPLALFAVLILVVRPWGDYPLNDDWIYARILKRFTETGKFVLDHDTGAAFLGQGLIASLMVRIFGFSHTHLRLLTMAFSGLLLFVIWRLLATPACAPASKRSLFAC